MSGNRRPICGLNVQTAKVSVSIWQWLTPSNTNFSALKLNDVTDWVFYFYHDVFILDIYMYFFAVSLFFVCFLFLRHVVEIKFLSTLERHLFCVRLYPRPTFLVVMGIPESDASVQQTVPTTSVSEFPLLCSRNSCDYSLLVWILNSMESLTHVFVSIIVLYFLLCYRTLIDEKVSLFVSFVYRMRITLCLVLHCIFSSLCKVTF